MQKVDWIATTISLNTNENRFFIVILSPSPNNEGPLYRVSHVVKVKHAPPL